MSMKLSGFDTISYSYITAVICYAAVFASEIRSTIALRNCNIIFLYYTYITKKLMDIVAS